MAPHAPQSHCNVDVTQIPGCNEEFCRLAFQVRPPRNLHTVVFAVDSRQQLIKVRWFNFTRTSVIRLLLREDDDGGFLPGSRSCDAC
ncbi:hypothetical protein TAL182_PC00013 (plasmid) [Rhizobium sp. TAL182]|nr:hypothetical protein TAL182_PC00013 [Rhizobium sp. TAL182]